MRLLDKIRMKYANSLIMVLLGIGICAYAFLTPHYHRGGLPAGLVVIGLAWFNLRDFPSVRRFVGDKPASAWVVRLFAPLTAASVVAIFALGTWWRCWTREVFERDGYRAYLQVRDAWLVPILVSEALLVLFACGLGTWYCLVVLFAKRAAAAARMAGGRGAHPAPPST